MRKLKSAGDGRRHAGWKVEPGRVRSLADDHAAVREGRSLFPTTVVSTASSPRFLVSGSNSPKTGRMIEKGPWSGFPVYTLTLEERATCPRSCPVWAGCYGNAMHLARRNDARDPDFMPALAAEVITVARQHPAGFVVRLHILGDFFSARYVLLWANLLDMCPNLHVFGYTARRVDLDDNESRRTAKAIDVLRAHMWQRFAVRTSHDEFGPERSVVVDEDPQQPDVIVCPAQVEATASCSTCGLCWAPAARGKTIAFLRHGIKNRGPSESTPQPGDPEPGSPDWWASRQPKETSKS